MQQQKTIRKAAKTEASGSRSKKDNKPQAQTGAAKPPGRPLAKRPSPVGGGRSPMKKVRGGESTRRAKQVVGTSKGRTTPKGSTKGNSAKRGSRS